MNHCARNYAAFTCGGALARARSTPRPPTRTRSHASRQSCTGAREPRSRPSSRQRGLPPYTGPDLPVNPPTPAAPDLEPARRSAAGNRRQRLARYYPGDAAVDVVGNDMYGSSAGWSGPQNEALYAFARRHGKPYGFPGVGARGRRRTGVRPVHLRLHQGRRRRSSSPRTTRPRPDRAGTCNRGPSAVIATAAASRRSASPRRSPPRAP